MMTLSHMINTKTSANGVHFRLSAQLYPPASVSETAHGRKKGISMNGKYCVQIAGMPEPVEVKCLEMHVNEPDDTDENSIL